MQYYYSESFTISETKATCERALFREFCFHLATTTWHSIQQWKCREIHNIQQHTRVNTTQKLTFFGSCFWGDFSCKSSNYTSRSQTVTSLHVPCLWYNDNKDKVNYYDLDYRIMEVIIRDVPSQSQGFGSGQLSICFDRYRLSKSSILILYQLSCRCCAVGGSMHRPVGLPTAIYKKEKDVVEHTLYLGDVVLWQCGCINGPLEWHKLLVLQLSL